MLLSESVIGAGRLHIVLWRCTGYAALVAHQPHYAAAVLRHHDGRVPAWKNARVFIDHQLRCRSINLPIHQATLSVVCVRISECFVHRLREFRLRALRAIPVPPHELLDVDIRTSGADALFCSWPKSERSSTSGDDSAAATVRTCGWPMTAQENVASAIGNPADWSDPTP